MNKEVKPEPEPASEQQTTVSAEAKKAAQPKAKAKRKRRAKRAALKSGAGPKRRRANRPYPTAPLDETLELAEFVQKVAGGQRVRRLTLLGRMNRSPSSSGVVTLITNSNKYGITSGSYAADYLEL